MYYIIPFVVLIDTILKTLEQHYTIKGKKIQGSILTAICYGLSILTVSLFAKSLTVLFFILILSSKLISKYISILIIEKMGKQDIIMYHFSFYSKKESKIFADVLRKKKLNVRTADGDYVFNGENYEKTLLVKMPTFSNKERQNIKEFLYTNDILKNMKYERQEIKVKKIKNTLEY